MVKKNGCLRLEAGEWGLAAWGLECESLALCHLILNFKPQASSLKPQASSLKLNGGNE